MNEGDFDAPESNLHRKVRKKRTPNFLPSLASSLADYVVSAASGVGKGRRRGEDCARSRARLRDASVDRRTEGRSLNGWMDGPVLE